MESQFLNNRDIVLFSLKPWDIEIGSSSRQYARAFAARGNRVLFINRALDRLSTVRFRNDSKVQKRLASLHDPGKSLEEAEKNIWVLDPPVILESINRIPFPLLFDRLNKMNNRRLAREINRAASGLGFRNPLLYIENDFIRAFYLNEMIDHLSTCIYYIRDYLPSQDYFRLHGSRLEPKMIGKADLVAANSVFLANYARQYNPNSYFVGQGCDLDLFDGKLREIPADLAAIRLPVIGYTGAILSTRLDTGLIREIAEKKPDWSVVLVGPEDECFRKSNLHQYPNIHFLGRKSLEELPAYISHFDVCINPQLVNDMTKGNYPLKIDEYLAMGKPVVATRTEAMEMFSGYVALADSPQEYIRCLETMLEEDPAGPERGLRIKFARSHTWENCVDQMALAGEPIKT